MKLLYAIVILQLGLLSDGYIYNPIFSVLVNMNYGNDNLIIVIQTHLAVQNYFKVPEPECCCLKYNSGCHAYGLVSFRAVPLPEQRHLKQTLINDSVCTFILVSPTMFCFSLSTTFCLTSTTFCHPDRMFCFKLMPSITVLIVFI